MTTTSERRWPLLGLIWSATVVSIWPVVFHWKPPAPSLSASIAAVAIACAAAAIICYSIVRVESQRLNRSAAASLVLLIFLQTAFAFYTHRYLVDRADVFSKPNNTVWQENLQEGVVQLSPVELPHSYRFLPNAIVFWMQILRVRFEFARDIFRLLAGLPLFYALYRYARLYTNHRGALISMMLAGLVYPTSFVSYGGQLADPLSHLSFVLAFIFIETENFPFLLTTLIVGSLSKESVLALCGFYTLFRYREKNFKVKAFALCAACIVAYFGVRVYVLHAAMHYQQVSAVNLHHVITNLLDPPWPTHFLITAAAYIPFLFLGWKDTAPALKQMFFYLLAVLFLSSLFFSWLNETRNFMPLVFVLSVVAGRYFESQGPTETTQPV